MTQYSIRSTMETDSFLMLVDTQKIFKGWQLVPQRLLQIEASRNDSGVIDVVVSSTVGELL